MIRSVEFPLLSRVVCFCNLMNSRASFLKFGIKRVEDYQTEILSSSPSSQLLRYINQNIHCTVLHLFAQSSWRPRSNPFEGSEAGRNNN